MLRKRKAEVSTTGLMATNWEGHTDGVVSELICVFWCCIPETHTFFLSLEPLSSLRLNPEGWSEGWGNVREEIRIRIKISNTHY